MKKIIKALFDSSRLELVNNWLHLIMNNFGSILFIGSIFKHGISINFSTRNNKFDLDDNFNIYDLNTYSGEYHVIKDGAEDQPTPR